MIYSFFYFQKSPAISEYFGIALLIESIKEVSTSAVRWPCSAGDPGASDSFDRDWEILESVEKTELVR